MPTSYDAVAYPASIFPFSHPDHLATVAHMHGLNPPPVETCRVLEIGGGDGYNLIGLAAAFPRARFLSFDLSSEAVSRGKQLVDAAGFDNIDVVVGDIMDFARDLKEPFDYIICHGVYAWVPDFVREGIFQLIRNVLSPDGVVFISYNAMPGGHFRLALREMLLRHVAGIEDHEERLTAARAFLEDYTQSEGDQSLPRQALRAEAQDMLKKRMHILFHDEMGECFAPQNLCDVAAAAARYGLQFLGDAGEGPSGDGFLPDDATDLSTEAVVKAAQQADDKRVRFFRQSLFVHAAQKPDRKINLDHMKDFFVSSVVTVASDEKDIFTCAGGNFAIEDPVLAAIIKRLIAAAPNRLPMTDLTDDEAIIAALFRFCEHGWVNFHTIAPPFALTPVERPKLSGLARAQMALGRDTVARLDQSALAVTEPGPRTVMELLDGEHTLEELRAKWAQTLYADDIDFDSAYQMTLNFALVQLPET